MMNKSQALIQEVEESKTSPTSDIQGNPFTLKKLVNPYPPKRCVILVPPLYLDQEVQSKLVEKNEGRPLEFDFLETGKAIPDDSIVVLCKFPKIKDKLLVGSSTFFLIAGFDEETKIETLKKLEIVTEAKDTSQYRKQETTFIASREKQKTLDTFWGNAKTFIETIAKELPDNYSVLNLSKAEEIVDKVDFTFEKLRDIQKALTASQLEAIKASVKKAKGPANASKRNKALFFIPIGMPGMGKTTFLNILKARMEEKGCTVTVISSDKIRQQHMAEAMQEDAGLDENDAFNQVGGEARYKFFGDIVTALQKTDTLTQKTHIILLDKNHVPQIIPKTLELIQTLKGKAKSKCKTRTVIINPHCTTGFQNQTSTFPFSLAFFLTCLNRVVDRKDHETLRGTNNLAPRVLIRFFKAYRDYRATEEGLKALKVNFLMEMPFTQEDVEAEKKLPEGLTASFGALLDTVEEPEEEQIIAFMNEVEKAKFEPKNQDVNLIAERVLNDLNQQFKLF